jgi:hypothetical protein
MEDKLHIAKTEKEYREGLKNPSKNIMYFPNANQMTMKGMKTPIKYYGITDGQITDEGYAKPGQKFNVNGVSTLEVRMPKMQYGGRVRYQTSGNANPSVDPEKQRLNAVVQELIFVLNNGNPEFRDDAIKTFASKIRTFHPSDIKTLGKDIIQMFGPNSAIKDEILKAGNFDANGDYNPEFQKGITYVGEDNPETYVDYEIPKNIEHYPTAFAPASELKSTRLDVNGFPTNTTPYSDFYGEIQGTGRSSYSPKNFYNDEFISVSNPNDPNTKSYYTVNKDSNNPFGSQVKRTSNTFGDIYSHEKDEAGDMYYRAPVYLREHTGISGSYDPYDRIIHDLVGPDKFFKTVKDAEKWINERKNEGYDESDIFERLGYDLKHSKNQPVTPTTNQPIVNTPVTPTTQPVVTTPSSPIIDSKYTPPQYQQGLGDPGKAYPGYTAPDLFGQGKKYKSIEEMQGRMREFLDETKNSYHLAGKNRGVDNTYGSTTHGFMNDPKLMQQFTEWESKKYPTQQTVTSQQTTTPSQTTTPTTNTPQDGSRPFGMNTLNYTDNEWYMTPGGSKYRTVGQKPQGMNFQLPDGSVVNSNTIPEAMINHAKTYPSAQIKNKLQQAYGKLDDGFNNFVNMVNMDRSDRAMKRYYNYKDKAEAAAEIGNDRQAGKLLRKANKQFERIAPLQQIQNANEARKNAEAEMQLDRMGYRLNKRTNRANERATTAEAEAQRTGRYYQDKGATDMYETSSKFKDKRANTANKYDIANITNEQELLRAVSKGETRSHNRELNNDYNLKKAKELEENQTTSYKKRQLNKQTNAAINYNDWNKSLQDDQIETNNQFNPTWRQGFQTSGTFFSQGRNVNSPFDEPYQKHEVQFKDYSKISPSQLLGKTTGASGLPYSGQNFYGSTDPSFSLNYNEGRMPSLGVNNNFQSTVDKPLTFGSPTTNTTGLNKDGKSGIGSGKPGGYTFTPGEWTQFAGTMMPAFYNLAQSMRKPHKFKEFQNPYDGRYLSNLASQHLPYDDSKIVAQQNRVMRNAQQQAPNFQIAQAYQMAGMDSLGRQMKDYQMKNEMANQDYASKYNQAAHNVAGAQQQVKAQSYERTRQAQAATNQLQHKAMTQFGIGINDLGKLMVNREMNQMDWALMGQIYQQYGLAPFEAVMSGKASWDDVVKFKGNPNAMGQLTNKVTSYQQKPTQTTQDASNTGVDASVTTTTTPSRAGAAGGGYGGAGQGLPHRGTGKTGGKVFNLNAIKKC